MFFFKFYLHRNADVHAEPNASSAQRIQVLGPLSRSHEAVRGRFLQSFNYETALSLDVEALTPEDRDLYGHPFSLTLATWALHGVKLLSVSHVVRRWFPLFS